MVTVNDKLKTFSGQIIKKVQEESEKKIKEYSERNNELLEKERDKALKEAQAIAGDYKRRAESEKQQIISKAGIDREHAILKKKKDIFDRVVGDIKDKSREYTSKPEYMDYLQGSIINGLSSLKSDEAILFFVPDDLEKNKEGIEKIIKSLEYENVKITLEKTEEDILGGCVCKNSTGTYRVDCSIRAVINDNLELIGRMVMDNL